MYKNLVKILSDKKITMKGYAEFLGISEKTVQNKIYGRTEFTLGEAMRWKKQYAAKRKRRTTL